MRQIRYQSYEEAEAEARRYGVPEEMVIYYACFWSDYYHYDHEGD